MKQTKTFALRGLLLVLSLILLQQILNAQQPLQLNFIGRYSTGIYDGGGCEIVAYDAGSKKLFSVNAQSGDVDIINLTNPFSPTLITTLDVSGYGASANSVAVKNGVIAVAVEANDKQDPGKAVFFDINGNYLDDVTVGALPDMICFSPDGNYVLTANEGEPNDSYNNDPDGSISVINISNGVANATVATAGFTSYNGQEATLRSQGIRIYGVNASASQDFEPEYISVSDDSKTAFVTLQENNAMAIVNIPTATVLSVKSLGFKDYSIAGNGFDGSDQNSGTVNIATWPVKGMYQPDGIYTYRVNGQLYHITANEGDVREYSALNEAKRLGSLTLDPIVFPNASTLKNNNNLGRLNVTNQLGDIDNDNDLDEIYAFGGRSFSVRDSAGNLIWDSGDQFEQLTFASNPANFNCSNTNNTKKNRSDDKGPEPEGGAIGVIGDSTYAFIGLERIGGVMVYNVTNPAAPRFVQYVTSRNFSQTPGANSGGDLAPEGLTFIPKSESPNGRNLLVVGNEVSGTISIYQVDVQLTLNSAIAVDTFVLKSSAPITIHSGIDIFEGGFSGLSYIPGSDKEFLVNTDRGPNADAGSHPNANGTTLLFSEPNYAPKYHHIKLDGDTIEIVSSTTIKRPGGSNATGLPNPMGSGGTGEEAWSNTTPTIITPDYWGTDPEGITEGLNNDLWISEEYGPTIWNVNKATGEVINRYTPYGNANNEIAIDTILKKRVANRGFEGVARTPNGKVYAILQSPLMNPDAAASDASRLHRLVEIDPNTGTTQFYAYEHDAPLGGSTGLRNKDFKIGDIVAINNQEFLVIEHGERNGFNKKNIYKISIANATPFTQTLFGNNTFEQLNTAANAINNGITPVSKTLLLDMLENGWDVTLDKPEGVTIIDEQTIAVVNDNDYGINSPNSDGDIIATGKRTKIYIFHLPQSLSLNTCTSIAADISVSGNDTICSGDLIALSAGPSPDYQWKLNGNDIGGATTANYTPLTSGRYAVLTNITDAACATLSADVNVLINALPGNTVTIAGDTSFCNGDSVVLTTAVSGYNYQWQQNNNNIINATTSSYKATSSGSYKINITNPVTGCTSTSVPITITVNALPTTTFSIPDTSICTGETGVLITNTTGNYTYEWRRNNVAIPNSNDPVFPVSIAGSYSLYITNNITGCSAQSAVKNLTVLALPPATIEASDTVLCQGQTSSITATTIGNLSYKWYKDNTLLPTTNYNIYTTEAGSYQLRVTNNATGCQNVSQIIGVTVNTLPDTVITVTGNTTFCYGDSVTFTANAAGLLYEWVDAGNNILSTLNTFSVHESGTYQLHITNTSTGCESSSQAYSVHVNPLPTGNIVTGNTVICEGGTVILSVVGSSTSYQWLKDGVPAINNFLSTYNAVVSGSYSVKLTDPATGCYNVTTPVIVTVNPLPVVTASGTVSSFCYGDSALLTATTPDSVTYQWFENGSATIAATTNQLVAYTSAGYKVMITDTNGCTAESDIIYITSHPNPSIPVITENGGVLATNAGYDYEWRYNGSIVTNVVTNTYQPDSSGQVVVQITDNNGCSNTSFTYNYVEVVSSLQNLTNTSVRIYPNPFSSTTTVDFDNNKVEQIVLFNLLGEQIAVFNPTNVLTINVAETMLTKGVYVLKAIVDGKQHAYRLEVM